MGSPARRLPTRSHAAGTNPIQLRRDRRHRPGTDQPLDAKRLTLVTVRFVHVQEAVLICRSRFSTRTEGPIAVAESSRTNVDDCFPVASLGRVEGGDGILERCDVADVRPQPSITHPPDDRGFALARRARVVTGS